MKKVCFCGYLRYRVVYRYTEPPVGETPFSFGDTYQRDICQCVMCGHVRNDYGFDFDPDWFYRTTYNQVTYGDRFRQEYGQIMALPYRQSNNKQRVQMLKRFFYQHVGWISGPFQVLDVGSGLCVFLAEMKKAGQWEGTAIDPDAQAVTHARDVVGVHAVQYAWGRDEPSPEIGKFDVVTFNNVIEHVYEPVRMLAQAQDHLKPGGVLYVEVPDGEEAVKQGKDRPELFVEHLHAFSVDSLALVVQQGGFRVLRIDRVVEPNGNLTLRGYCGYEGGSLT